MGKDFIYKGSLRNGNSFSARCTEFPGRYAIVDVMVFSREGSVLGRIRDEHSSHRSLPELQVGVRKIASE
jgi:hypothetical protein